jgi:radical SAM protein with 4Fe4S-binding SPASM domain
MNYYQKILQKCLEQNVPLFPYIELTRRCNLNCVHCYLLKDQIKKSEELTFAEIEKLLKDLRRLGALFLTLTGGEIFLRDDALDVIKLSSSEKFAVHLMTNGTLLDAGIVRELKKIKVAGVDVTLFAMKSNVHDDITGTPSSHQKTVKAIEHCLKSGLPLTIKMPIMRQNVKEFDAVKRFAGECKARLVFDLIIIPTDAGEDRMRQFGLNEEEMREFISSNGGRVEEKEAQEGLEIFDDEQPLCGAGASTLCIAPEGTILPCPGLRVGVGNIRKQALADIWSSSMLDFIRKARYSDSKLCRECSIKNYCARCPGAALSEKGSIYAPFTASCTLAKVMASIG